METRMKLRMLRTDRGGEFTSNEFTKYCKENGIARQLTAPYSPQQNGVVERRNRTVLSTTRSMMKAMKLPLTFWAEAVKHAIYILNRVPTRALVDKTPYEALYNRKPNLENLRIFGCTAYAKITIPHLKKLDDRSIPMIYLGVEEGSKACRLYDPKGKRKHVSRDVRFMETKLWDWDNNGEETSTQDSFWASFNGRTGGRQWKPNTVNSENNDNTYQEQEPITAPDSPITRSTYTYNPDSEDEEEAIISSLRNSENRFDDTPVRGGINDKKWIEAMEIDLDSINKNNTWTLTTLPTNQKAIGLKWVFKTKRDAKGKIIKYKARLVAKGYVQEQGIDFDEVFAPVARIETVRLILALAAYHGWQVHHLDVKSAFLHGDLKEEVYVTQPEGFIQQGNSGKVYKLTKALYGLRQAPRAWNMKLDQTLKSLDFKKCNLEQAVYTKRSKTSTLIVGVYVDDLIITGTPRKEIDLFKSQMKDKFEMSDLGLLAYYLGIEVTQTGGEITIKQTGYINKILKETSMMDSNDTKIPMDPGTKLVKAEDGNSVDATYYRSLIGSLRYLLHTRPDLSYSVGLVTALSANQQIYARTQRIILSLGFTEKSIKAIALVRNQLFMEKRRQALMTFAIISIGNALEMDHFNVELVSGDLHETYTYESFTKTEVDAYGCVNLGGLSRVSAGYGTNDTSHIKFSLSISSSERVVTTKEWQIDKTNEIQASLPSELPSFVKLMLPSHVTVCFWLGLPKNFCDAHLPKDDVTVVLVDEDDQEYNTKYLDRKVVDGERFQWLTNCLQEML
ncbi:zinc finger, CCHC-type containing protein [Tanacetum coccineum]